MFRQTSGLRLGASALAMIVLSFSGFGKVEAGANPRLANYGYGQIVANPHYPIVGETATISVTISNDGDADAVDVPVKISFNDWGVTFQGWQQIGTIQTVTVPAGGTATVSVTNVFNNRTHTCVEALILEPVDPNKNSTDVDDRGQINLEVINAGENFGYDVPVGNHGDDPVNLVIRAEALGNGTVPGQPVGVRVEPQQLVLMPGEEKPVHVEVNLNGVPAGMHVQVIVEAIDLNATGLEDRNNVIFDIQVTTAYQLKADALAALAVLKDSMPSISLKNRVNAAMTLVKHSRDPRFWNGENRLKKNGGAAVFALEAAAILTLETLLKSNIGLAQKAEVDRVIRMLTDADRIIAETAIGDAGNPVKAVMKKTEGDEEREEGEYPQAVGYYAKAWGISVKL